MVFRIYTGKAKPAKISLGIFAEILELVNGELQATLKLARISPPLVIAYCGHMTQISPKVQIPIFSRLGGGSMWPGGTKIALYFKHARHYSTALHHL